MTSNETSRNHPDSLGLWDKTLSLPQQLTEAAEAIDTIQGLPQANDIEQVLILGMGDSGFAGDVVAAGARPFSPLPIMVHNSYLQPSWVGASTLVIAISASGATEETNESIQLAIQAGASVLAITNGGEMAEIARRNHASVVPISGQVAVPRAAVGSLAVPAMLALEQLGLFPGARSWIEEAAEVLTARAAQLISDKSEAKKIARKIGRTMPIIYGGGAIGSTAAKRWKNSVNLNVKAPAFSAAMPELCYNELLGWGQNGDVTRQVFTQVQLRHDEDHPQVQRRFDYVEEKTLEVMNDVLTVQATGEGPIAQLLDLVMLGDMVSLEMAASEGLDPGPVPITHDLRDWLRAGELS